MINEFLLENWLKSEKAIKTLRKENEMLKNELKKCFKKEAKLKHDEWIKQQVEDKLNGVIRS